MTERKFDGWFMKEWFTDWPKKPQRMNWVAKKLGINPAHLSQVVKGNRNATRAYLEDVAAVLKMPYDYENGGGAGWFWFPVPPELKGKGKIDG